MCGNVSFPRAGRIILLLKVYRLPTVLGSIFEYACIDVISEVPEVNLLNLYRQRYTVFVFCVSLIFILKRTNGKK